MSTILHLLWLAAVMVLIVVAGSFAGSWLSTLVGGWLDAARLDPAVRRLVQRGVQPLVVAIAVIAALDWVGVDLTALVALMGAAGFAIGMALRDSLSNVASGALLLTLRPLREGEYVRVADREGIVVDHGLFTTALKTPQGALVVIPNDLVLKSPIENWSRNGIRRVDVEVSVEAKTDLAKISADLVDAVTGVEGVLKEPAPEVALKPPTALGVPVLVTAWAMADSYGPVRTALVSAVLATLKAKRVAVGMATSVAEK